MSECISRHGEYGSHADVSDFRCGRCGVFDEDGAVARVAQLTAALERVEALVVEVASFNRLTNKSARWITALLRAALKGEMISLPSGWSLRGGTA